MPYLRHDGDVAILYLGAEGAELDPQNPENRFTNEWLSSVNDLLDEVEATGDAEGSGALVVTATGKFFTNGLDVPTLLGDSTAYLGAVHNLYARLLALPLPTVAAINGHAFGAGAMLATALDYRIMRVDRGYYCLPEVSLGIPFSPGMRALLRGRLPAQTALEAMATGRRYGGPDAHAAGIVEATAPEQDVLSSAIARAAEHAGTRGKNLGVIKSGLHEAALAALAMETTL
ncbi:Enoyl-CoA hydratase/isomerase [Segniliparus rotundus DSM 44985]|uniref:Enoyl-CoA hydratase/isomerase n=1 Tax=Segniliparus rotundus (strain ATCC BAA-972 / CDC 1076 / CIP 108378 / DSM 44985 / JCM 13578) TaxID=640132 RepID=D6Z790_SEGRD|nr:enoyl-CoA hydratase/isomerase family protein [Segniliparus rotundus]ADG97820.1 Enoyl-CoA hydratase/isomerase [Segniliparus rotundus DSM 44985]